MDAPLLRRSSCTDRYYTLIVESEIDVDEKTTSSSGNVVVVVRN